MGVRAVPFAAAGCVVLLLATPAIATAAPAQVALRPAGGAAGTPVVLQGSGFAPSRRVLVGVAGARPQPVRASRAGAFTARLTVPRGRRGTVPIVSRAGRTRVVSRFSVIATEGPEASVEIAASSGARVRASPAALPPGGVVVLRGAGFRPRRPLIVFFLGRSRRVLATREGRFTAALPVPASRPPGALRAVVVGGRARLALRLDVLAPAATGLPPAGGTGALPGGTAGTPAPGGGGQAPPSPGPGPLPGPAAPVNTAPPGISGVAQVGRTLTAATGTWTGAAPLSFTFAWRRCDASGAACTAIAGATHSTYKVASGDARHTLRVAVTARNAAGQGTATSAPTAPVAAPPPATGQVALWHMDETSGTVMHDSIGGHDGTLSNVALGLPGFTGTAYGFSRSFVSVPSAAPLNPGSANITITVHLNTTGAPATPDWDLIRKGLFTTAGGEYKVEYQPTGQASCGFAGSSGSSELIAGPSLRDGAWHTVQCVKTATAIRLVVDGQTFSKAATIGSISNSAALVIGARPGSEFFVGALDEASVRLG